VTPTNFWIRWLQVVLGAVLFYSLVLVFAGRTAEGLFTLLGFGPPATLAVADGHEYLKLPLMVLGAVLAGWSVLMLLLVRGPLRTGQSWVAGVLLWPVAVWFVLDTSMSLALGYPSHALFNLPFVFALGVPLLRLRATMRPLNSGAKSE
jgi:hypothetical protein